MDVIAFLRQTECIIQDQHYAAIIAEGCYVLNLGDQVYLELEHLVLEDLDTERIERSQLQLDHLAVVTQAQAGWVDVAICFAATGEPRYRDQVKLKFLGTHAQLRQYLDATTVH